MQRDEQHSEQHDRTKRRRGKNTKTRRGGASEQGNAGRPRSKEEQLGGRAEESEKDKRN
jgi:hypothetical protein